MDYGEAKEVGVKVEGGVQGSNMVLDLVLDPELGRTGIGVVMAAAAAVEVLERIQADYGLDEKKIHREEAGAAAVLSQ